MEMKSRMCALKHLTVTAAVSFLAVKVVAVPSPDEIWAEELDDSFGIDSDQSIMEAQDCGLVKGHLSVNGWLKDVAEVRRLYAPPYFCADLRWAFVFNGKHVATTSYRWRPEVLMREGALDGWRVCSRLYPVADGRAAEAETILCRLKWLGSRLPYWGDSHYADRPDYRHNTPLQFNIEGGCLAQTIIFGMFGIKVRPDFSIEVAPHLPKSTDHIALQGLHLAGRTFDVRCSHSKDVVVTSGKECLNAPPGARWCCLQPCAGKARSVPA